MDFAGAVRGHLSISEAVKSVQVQAETELNRKLSPRELDALIDIHSPITLFEKIKQVNRKILSLYPYLK